MPANNCQRRELPYAVRRQIRSFRPEFRGAVERFVREKLESGLPLQPSDVGEFASGLIFGEDECEYDRKMERICIQAFREGKSQPLTRVIDDLRARIAGAAPVQD